MTIESDYEFVNALREVLGLDPLDVLDAKLREPPRAMHDRTGRVLEHRPGLRCIDVAAALCRTTPQTHRILVAMRRKKLLLKRGDRWFVSAEWLRIQDVRNLCATHHGTANVTNTNAEG